MNTAEDNAIPNWSLAKQAAGRLIAAADQTSGLQDEQQERFAVWEIDPLTGRALTETLILLGVHAAVRDAASLSANASHAAMGRLGLHAIAESLRTRPRHELFASLPAAPTNPDARRIDQLRLMSYTVTSRSTLSLERLVQEASLMILATAGALTGPTPTLYDLT